MQPHNTYSADCIAQSVFFFATPFTIFVAFYLSPTHPLLRSGVKSKLLSSLLATVLFLELLSQKYSALSSFVDSHRIMPPQTTNSQQLLIIENLRTVGFGHQHQE